MLRVNLTEIEQALRQRIKLSKWCTLLTGCEVVKVEDDTHPIIEYRTKTDDRRRIRGQWLVGADGKVGVVRKHFLEPTAGIRQEEGAYRYSGTWVAANLKLTPPTPETHPAFPLWDLGYTPEQVYDLFWPQGWHFCSPPGKATASGRFGPHSERLWRHEFRQEDWNESMDAVELLWAHLEPMISRDSDEHGRKFPQSVQFPRECIEIIRCRPFRFVHKVVNRWFDKRTILIGDAAHVFPPFAGQGIGSGVRDAHQLAWRLALLLKEDTMSAHASHAFLQAWASERRKSVDDAAFLSSMNGNLCNLEPSIWRLGYLRLLSFATSISSLGRILDIQSLKERQGFRSVNDGFLLKKYRGGVRLAQITVRSSLQGPILSDHILRPKGSIFTLLIISDGNHTKSYRDAETAIQKASISPIILSEESIVLLSPRIATTRDKAPVRSDGDQKELFWPVPGSQMADCLPGYDPGSFFSRLGPSTAFALIRPDFFIYSCAKNAQELGKCIDLLKSHLHSGKE